MRVQVRLRREAGAFRPQYGNGGIATGDLHLTYRTADGRKIAMLQLLGADRAWPSLFEPRLVALSAREFGFIGFERHEQAWVLQQWDCELL
ncbi:MAG: hypothetical protein EOP24_25945 [Hyphomicrobiales bacterium]|nr:MAG: hypothetical protein EOP24_25945 [Hyphomicrobiales bacterium]